MNLIACPHVLHCRRPCQSKTGPPLQGYKGLSCSSSASGGRFHQLPSKAVSPCLRDCHKHQICDKAQQTCPAAVQIWYSLTEQQLTLFP